MAATTHHTAQVYRMKTAEHMCPFGLKTVDLLKRKGYAVDDHTLTSREEIDAFKEQEELIRVRASLLATPCPLLLLLPSRGLSFSPPRALPARCAPRSSSKKPPSAAPSAPIIPPSRSSRRRKLVASARYSVALKPS